MGNKMEKDRCLAEIQGLHDYRAIIPEIVENPTENRQCDRRKPTPPP